MKLSVSQTAQLSRLLDEALPLDAAGRRAWLEQQSAEYPDLAEALRKVLLPDDSQAAGFDRLAALPKLGGAMEAPALTAGNLHAGMRVGPYELIRPLGVGGMAQVAEMRYFGGYSEKEIAETLEITERTVQRDWEKARLILAAALR